MNKEVIQSLIRHPKTRLIAVGIGSFGVGLVLGYLLGDASGSGPNPPRGREDLDKEVVKTIREYKARQAEKVVIDEEEYQKIAAEKLEEPVASEEIEPESTEESDGPIRRNIFAEAAAADDEWNYEEELKNRDSSAPYVIHKDEFYADELGYQQRTFTYFDGDDIMADEDDKPVYNYETLTGELKFGHGSGDSKVVHIRNEPRQQEYEIVKDPGLYSIEILGLNIEQNDRVRDLEHSTPRKFRPQE